MSIILCRLRSWDSGIFMLHHRHHHRDRYFYQNHTTSSIPLTATTARWRRNPNRRRLLQDKVWNGCYPAEYCRSREQIESVERRPSESAGGAPLEMRLAHLSQRVETVAELLNRIASRSRCITAAGTPSGLTYPWLCEISEALTNVQMERIRGSSHRHDAHLAQIRSERIRLDELNGQGSTGILRPMPRGKCSQSGPWCQREG